MKNKKIVILLLLLVMTVSMTGCTKLIKKDNKPVQHPETGQSLPKNILCKPEDSTTLKIYEENNIELSDLPKCKDFKITSGGYEGIWTTIFVKPLAWFIIKVGTIVKNYGLSIILITILIRTVMVPITLKTAMQSENMKKVKPELAKLEKKYKDKKDPDSMNQKTQEMLILYKKYNISPVSGCLFSLIQIPLFFAFYEALNRLPAIFEETLGPFQLGTSPWTAIQNGQYYYVIFVILVFIVTFFSFKNVSSTMGEEQARQFKMMLKIMIFTITFASFSISIGIAFYWIFNSGFTIIQNILVKRGKLDVRKA